MGIALLVLLGLWLLPRPVASPPASAPVPPLASALVSLSVPAPASAPAPPLALPPASAAQPVAYRLRPAPARADSVVAFALRQLGAPYRYAGVSPTLGFDCSGFLNYVYGHFGVAVPHSSALLLAAGQPVARAQARPGDVVVFTGTAAGATTAGHAGIVVTAGPGGLQFVHSSSARRESGVKISRVEGTDYERRFMQIRRVL